MTFSNTPKFSTKLENGKEDIGLRVTFDKTKNTSILTIHCDLLAIKDNLQMHFYDNYRAKNKFKDLSFSVVIDLSCDHIHYHELHVSHWRNNILTLNNLEDHAKGIKSINRKLAKIEKSEGIVRDHFEYMMRVARALKVAGFFLTTSECSRDIYHKGYSSLRTRIEHHIYKQKLEYKNNAA